MQSWYGAISRATAPVPSVELLAVCVVGLLGLAASAAVVPHLPAEQLERILSCLG